MGTSVRQNKYMLTTLNICLISFQIYKGLDIITNKVTKEELQQCPHHMIDYLDPLKENHTVVDYRDMAVPIVSFTVFWTCISSVIY